MFNLGLHLSISPYLISAPHSAPNISMIRPYARRLTVLRGAAFMIGYQGSWVTEQKMSPTAF